VFLGFRLIYDRNWFELAGGGKYELQEGGWPAERPRQREPLEPAGRSLAGEAELALSRPN